MSYRIRSYNTDTDHIFYLPTLYLLEEVANADAELLAKMFPHIVYTVEQSE